MVFPGNLPARPAVVLLLGALIVALGLHPAASADAAKTPSRLYACVTTSYKTLNLSTRQARCPGGQSKISWRTDGSRGARGARGLQGVAGSVGATGAVGVTGAAGAKGETGATGAVGAQGERGPAGSPDTPEQVLGKLREVDGPGSGLDSEFLGGFGVDVFQKRVSGTCATGSAISAIAADGTTTCQSTEVVAPLTLEEDGTTDVALTVKQTDPSSGQKAIDVQHAGVGPGVFANTTGGNSIWGVTGSISAAAVIGDTSSGEAVVARQNGAICEQNIGKCNGIGAIVGRHDGEGGLGVRGFVTDPNGAIGVLGEAGINGGTGVGVRGENANEDNDGNAVEGVTNGGGAGVRGSSITASAAGNGVEGVVAGSGAGIFGQGPVWAGRFAGNVLIDGDLTVTGNTSGLTVDDPRSPTSQTLHHTPVQTDELTVNYSGNVTTDIDGLATVQLPGYATELGGDWRYQLTPIGQFGQVIVDREVDEDGTFVVRSENGETKVSWAVTGVRHDPQATSNAFEVERPKSGAERGRFADPSLHGAPATRSLAPVATPSTLAPAAKSRLASDG